MPVENLVHLVDLRQPLGLASTRAIRVLCERYQIPIVKINRRIDAVRERHYDLLLSRASGTANENHGGADPSCAGLPTPDDC